MARLKGKGSSTLLVKDENDTPLPLMPWGTVHNLAPTEVTAARNAAPISAHCGVVSIVAIGGAAHFRQGDASVIATVADPYLPEGEYHELPLFEGDDWSYVSVVSATGSGTIAAQIIERQ